MDFDRLQSITFLIDNGQALDIIDSQITSVELRIVLDLISWLHTEKYGTLEIIKMGDANPIDINFKRRKRYGNQ